MILAILQARMSSTRLPGKVLKEVAGKTMLAYQIDRIKQSVKIDKIVLATSTNQEDDILESVARNCEIDFFRGDLENVLKRFYNCAIKYNPAHVVRLTGDCPIIDAKVIDEVIELHVEKGSDYTSNSFERTYPDGLDVEIMTFKALQKTYRKAKLAKELEHVTYYIYTHPEEFNIVQLKNDIDYSSIRWTLDTEDDLSILRNIISTQKSSMFYWKDLL